MDNQGIDKDDTEKVSSSIKSTSRVNNKEDSFFLEKEGEIIKTIPLFGEKFDLTKKTEEAEVNLEKKWITSTKKIEIPIRYEEIFINGKELESHTEHEIKEIFSKLKEKISDVFSHEKAQEGQKNGEEGIDKNHQHHHRTHEPNEIEIKIRKDNAKKEGESEIQMNRSSPEGKLVSISLDRNGNGSKKEENIIPIWGEEITINKKMVKMGEIVIRKYEINEKQKVDVDIRNEKLTIKYPDNYKEEIT